MTRSNQHVVLSNGRWCIRTDESAAAHRTFETQLEAIRAAREIARRLGAELFVHGRNGQVRERDSFNS